MGGIKARLERLTVALGGGDRPRVLVYAEPGPPVEPGAFDDVTIVRWSDPPPRLRALFYISPLLCIRPVEGRGSFVGGRARDLSETEVEEIHQLYMESAVNDQQRRAMEKALVISTIARDYVSAPEDEIEWPLSEAAYLERAAREKAEEAAWGATRDYRPTAWKEDEADAEHSYAD